MPSLLLACLTHALVIILQCHCPTLPPPSAVCHYLALPHGHPGVSSLHGLPCLASPFVYSTHHIIPLWSVHHATSSPCGCAAPFLNHCHHWSPQWWHLQPLSTGSFPAHRSPPPLALPHIWSSSIVLVLPPHIHHHHTTSPPAQPSTRYFIIIIIIINLPMITVAK